MADHKRSENNARPIPSWLNSSLWQGSLSSSKAPSISLDSLSPFLSESNAIPTRVADNDEISGLSHVANTKHPNDVDNAVKVLESDEINNEVSQGMVVGREPVILSAQGKDLRRTTSNTVWTDDKRIAIERRTARLYSELAQHKIQISELRKLVTVGLPSDSSLRPTCWKILLGYLPTKPDDWEKELANKRAEYSQFKSELIINPSDLSRRHSGSGSAIAHRISQFDEAEEDKSRRWRELHGVAVVDVDHPLSQGSDSAWYQYFKDAEVAEQIDRDVKRTHPDHPFFSSDDLSNFETQEAMKRILFVYAKLNPGICYVQGMNEILAPLYFVFKTDPDSESSLHAEPDAFFCLSALMSDFRDHFCKQLDNSMVGIRSTIAQMAQILRNFDPDLWRHLEFVAKINPQFYAFRWITLLLTQDFEFDVVLRIWDSLLANPEGPMEILLRICVSMLVCVREKLLAGDFSTNLKLLQRYPFTDVERLIQTAERLKSHIH